MKKALFIALVASSFAFAVDYTAMSATELSALRGTVATEDKAAFQAAMQEKMSTMTADERQTFTQARTTNPGTGNSGGTGSGAGGSSSGGGGAGSGSGSGGGAGNGGRGGGRH